MTCEKRSPYIRYCNCVNTYQDNLYGDRLRVSNYSKKNDIWLCTCCGNETHYYIDIQNMYNDLYNTFDSVAILIV